MNSQRRRFHPGLLPVDDTVPTRESWKLFQIMAESAEGFERLMQSGPHECSPIRWKRL